MVQCRLCRHPRSALLLDSLRTGQTDTFALRRCRNCGFVTLDPLPSGEMLRQYYDDDYWLPTDPTTDGIMARFLMLRMAPVLREIKRLVPAGGRILDWGAGDGRLVHWLNADGFDAVGIDPYSRSADNDAVIAAAIEDAPFPSGSFDAVLAFHLIEHLPDPVEAVRAAVRLLKPGGVLFAEVPNIASLEFRIFRSRWQPLEIPYHLNHFTPDTMVHLMTDAGADRIVHMSFFSHRVSPSTPVLSVAPGLAPKEIRRRHRRYPLPLSFGYLICQLVAYPMAAAGAVFRKGAVLRVAAKTRSGPSR